MYIPIITKKEFDKLSREEKRVIIAKDVLLRLKQEQFKISDGYFKIPSDINISSVKEIVNTEVCEGCLRGAMFCSYVGINNDVLLTDLLKLYLPTANNYLFNNKSEKTLEIFNKNELLEMELYFEEYTTDDLDYEENILDGTSSEINEAYDSYLINKQMIEHVEKCDLSKSERLRKVMNYIINTNGEPFSILDVEI